MASGVVAGDPTPSLLSESHLLSSSSHVVAQSLRDLGAGAQLTRASKGRLATQHGWRRAGGVKAARALAGAGATAAACTGSTIGQLTEQAAASARPVDAQEASQPSAETPPEMARWQRRRRFAQWLVPLTSGADEVLDA